jgi:RNA polymerase sigma-70 factor (ECF subfamily)
VSGPAVALEQLDTLDLDAYHLFHATRADLLRRLDRVSEAADAYRAALERTESPVEREFLQRRLGSLG